MHNLDIRRVAWYSTDMPPNRTLTPKQKQRILERDGYVCFYCLGEATEVDHIVPWSYTFDDHPDNLISSCSLCNALASDKVFPTLAAKAEYIAKKRQSRRHRSHYPMAICPDCGQPFCPGVNGASNLLCGRCYEPLESYEPP